MIHSPPQVHQFDEEKLKRMSMEIIQAQQKSKQQANSQLALTQPSSVQIPPPGERDPNWWITLALVTGMGVAVSDIMFYPRIHVCC